jgi:AcrR family transcriptional regulator
LPSQLRQSKGDRYHHGDLRAALIEAATELISERGVRDFSLAEVSRRLRVAVSAPYAHFSDRDQLLAAVAVRAYELFYADLVPDFIRQEGNPAGRLAAMARAYVRFAAANRRLFELLFTTGLDKVSHPEIEAAEQPVSDAFLDSVRALAEGDETLAENLAIALEASVHGHALFLLDGDYGTGEDAVNQATERAALATLALIEGRHQLASKLAP